MGANAMQVPDAPMGRVGVANCCDDKGEQVVDRGSACETDTAEEDSYTLHEQIDAFLKLPSIADRCGLYNHMRLKMGAICSNSYIT